MAVGGGDGGRPGDASTDGGGPRGGGDTDPVDSEDPKVGPDPERKPTAVSLGDSLTAGEGGGGYLGVDPGIFGADTNPFYCHRSGAAYLMQADLPGIERKVNLACSGAEFADVGSPNSQHTAPAQLAELKAVATESDVKLIAISVGINDLRFSDVLLSCVADYATQVGYMKYKIWISIFDSNDPRDRLLYNCPRYLSQSATSMPLAAMGVVKTLVAIRATMAAIRVDGKVAYPPGSYRLVLVGYPSIAEAITFPKGSNDTSTTSLQERLYAGCPFAWAHSNLMDDWVDRLDGYWLDAANMAGAEYLDISEALNGQRLCESSNTIPAVHPLKLLVPDGANSNRTLKQVYLSKSRHDFDELQKAVSSILDPTAGRFHWVQEGAHPNAEGYRIIGGCLSSMWTDPGSSECRHGAGRGFWDYDTDSDPDTPDDYPPVWREIEKESFTKKKSGPVRHMIDVIVYKAVSDGKGGWNADVAARTDVSVPAWGVTCRAMVHPNGTTDSYPFGGTFTQTAASGNFMRGTCHWSSLPPGPFDAVSVSAEFDYNVGVTRHVGSGSGRWVLGTESSPTRIEHPLVITGQLTQPNAVLDAQFFAMTNMPVPPTAWTHSDCRFQQWSPKGTKSWEVETVAALANTWVGRCGQKGHPQVAAGIDTDQGFEITVGYSFTEGPFTLFANATGKVYFAK